MIETKGNTIFYLLFGLFILPVYSFSQTFSFSPGKVVAISGSTDSLYFAGETFIKSNSLSNLFLRWKKIEESIPAAWNASFCDNKVCYVGFPDSSDLAGINSGQSLSANHMVLDIVSHGAAGIGLIKMLVYEIANPSNRDTITYSINLSSPTGIGKISGKSQVILYPNPASDYLTVKFDLPLHEGVNGRIINNAGQLMDEFLIPVGLSSFDKFQGNLPSGLYNLCLESETGEIIFKKFAKIQVR